MLIQKKIIKKCYFCKIINSMKLLIKNINVKHEYQLIVGKKGKLSDNGWKKTKKN